MLCQILSRVLISTMHIGRAFCVEAGRVVDIYQARALFFAQDVPRRRFQFLCSDDKCRRVSAARVTGVNYDKLVEDDRNRIFVKPHFRMNRATPHSPECEWVAREQLLEARNSLGTEPTRRGRVNGFRRLKMSDLIDVFSPSSATTWTTTAGVAESSGATSSGEKASTVKHDAMSPGHPPTIKTSVDCLAAVVSVYELLEVAERHEAALRIGAGPKLPYSKAFCRVERYFSAKGARIFHGGVRVRLHGPNFSVRFFDRVAAPDEEMIGKALDVSLYLKRQSILDHWNGKFLIAQLSEAVKPGHYAHCYFFGGIQPHRAASHRLIVDVESLDYLAFTVRRRVGTTADESQ